MRIGIDMMGGDFSPESTISGSLLARDELHPGEKILFIGDREIIQQWSDEHQVDISDFDIVHTSDRVEMGAHPLGSLNRHPNASIFLGQKMLKSGEIDGFCSAGNTGAMLVGAMQIVSPIPGIIRPAISAVIPNVSGGNSLLLDVGLNPDARPDVLFQYGLIGAIYASNIMESAEPEVSLLNIGKEEDKGNLVAKSTYQLMKDTGQFNFAGNIEANELFHHKVTDVVVCDGFVGNIVLKEAEAMYKLISSRKVGNGYFEMFNFENFGGTPVLGVRAPMVIGHGISNSKAIKNMILETRNVIHTGLIEKITESIHS